MITSAFFYSVIWCHRNVLKGYPSGPGSVFPVVELSPVVGLLARVVGFSKTQLASLPFGAVTLLSKSETSFCVSSPTTCESSTQWMMQLAEDEGLQ